MTTPLQGNRGSTTQLVTAEGIPPDIQGGAPSVKPLIGAHGKPLVGALAAPNLPLAQPISDAARQAATAKRIAGIKAGIGPKSQLINRKLTAVTSPPNLAEVQIPTVSVPGQGAMPEAFGRGQPDEPQAPQPEAAPLLQEPPASVQEKGPEYPYARDMSVGELIQSVSTMSHAAINHLDLQEPVALNDLVRQLASHSFDVANMSTNHVVKLLVALQGLTGPRLDASRGELLGALCGAGGTTISARIADIDLETFIFLAKSNLPLETKEALAAEFRKCMPALQKQLMRKLVGLMVEGVKARSPIAISNAVDTARLVHDALVAVSPMNEADEPSELKTVLSDALKSVQFKGEIVGLQLVFLGKTGGLNGQKPVFGNEKNAVSRAAGWHAYDTQLTTNVKLFRSAVALANKTSSKAKGHVVPPEQLAAETAAKAQMANKKAR